MKAGRKPMTDNQKRKHVAVNLSPETIEKIATIKNKSRFIENAILAALAQTSG